jgi:hypothetical protein
MGKEIIKFGEKICLYCGNSMNEKYEEYTRYFECDCKDAKKVREIRAKIQKLELELPNHKFEIVQRNVLLKM